MQKYNVAVVGATGLVGQTFLKVLKERNFPIDKLYLYASARSAGKKVEFDGKEYEIIELKDENIKDDIEIALFSAGGEASKVFAPKFSCKKAIVVDNSSAWRMDKNVPLVVPEANPEDVEKHLGIIANPNCSTIQMVLALNPLHNAYKIKRVVVSTYQSVTGTGVKAVEQLMGERNKATTNSTEEYPMAYKYPIDLNVIPQIDVFLENGYTKEEMKMVHETQKILHDDTIQVVPTTVRVPVYRSHSESVLVETEEPVSVEAFKAACEKFPGLQVKDNPAEQIYPMPLYTSNQNDCEIGRIRKDLYNDKGMNFWIVGDQIRKGAALNALQIAEYLVEKQAF